MLKDFMTAKIISHQENRGDVYCLDPLRAAVIMLSVCHFFRIKLTDSENCHLCTALCLPRLEKEDFLNYYKEFSQEDSLLTVYVFDFFFQKENNYQV